MKKQNFEVYFIEFDFDDDIRFQTIVRTFQLNEKTNDKLNYIQKVWYSNIYDYYVKHKTSKDANKIFIIAFKRKINKYR